MRRVLLLPLVPPLYLVGFVYGFVRGLWRLMRAAGRAGQVDPLVLLIAALATVAMIGLTYLWFEECVRLRPWWYCLMSRR